MVEECSASFTTSGLLPATKRARVEDVTPLLLQAEDYAASLQVVPTQELLALSQAAEAPAAPPARVTRKDVQQLLDVNLDTLRREVEVVPADSSESEAAEAEEEAEEEAAEDVEEEDGEAVATGAAADHSGDICLAQAYVMTPVDLQQYIKYRWSKAFVQTDDKQELIQLIREQREHDKTLYNLDDADDEDPEIDKDKPDATYWRLHMIVNRTEVSASERKRIIFKQFGYLGFTQERYKALVKSKKRVALGLLAAWAYYLHNHSGMDFVGDAPSKLRSHMAKLQSLPFDKLPWTLPTRRQVAGLDPVDFSSPASWKLR